MVTCPLQHVTHGALACDASSGCQRLERGGHWYSGHCSVPRAPPQPYFYCRGAGQFLSYQLLCDFRRDCADGGDEDFCLHPEHRTHAFACGLGQYVDFDQRCDGDYDCVTKKDEKDCSRSRQPIVFHLHPPAVLHLDMMGGFTVTTLPAHTQCPATHFQCHSGFCLPVYLRCNDVNDCLHHDDEIGCQDYTCPGFYRCRDSSRMICVHLNHLCDGTKHCPLYDDELLCDQTACPQSCACYGRAFTCTNTFPVRSFLQLRYLEAKGSGLGQSDVTQNAMLVHLGVQACGWRNVTYLIFPNLHSLDLSYNLLRSVKVRKFEGCPHLQSLNLAGNLLSGALPASQDAYVLLSLVVFNFSAIQISVVNMTELSVVMPELQLLDLSWSEVESLQGRDVFQNLRVLDLRGCPLSEFARDFMKGMHQLSHVSADDFKLCCSVVLPDAFKGECLAPSDEISSCSDLLKATAYRWALAVFAVLAILGNLSGFVYRLYFWSENMRTGFAVFVCHLCVSDFLMGVYLALIGVADQVYAGVYLWRHADWKNSAVCSLAGLLSFLSSEVSAFLMCIITVDRFLVLRFPFSRIRFDARTAHVTCIVIWLLGVTLAAVPLLPVTSHWGFYRQTGICIPLPFTRADFPGHGYSFSVMIVCNLVLCVLIAAGQCLIFWSVRPSSLPDPGSDPKPTGGQGARSKEAAIARRLLTIALSDFLCWFPIGLCGLLAARGVLIPGEVSVAMAIFILPLNSAINPLLYTLSVMLERQQRARERRLLQILRVKRKK
ncbi:hypothetical protein ACOMHN_050423 [Nucella lapillus]